MIVSDVLGNMIEAAMLALTPMERWSAARRLNEGPLPYAPQYRFIVTAVATLVVLIALLWWISHRRKVQSQSLTRELFAEHAVRQGLSGRERQILLAIAMRSGLRKSHDIFTTVDAFDRGTAKLLAECVRTRTIEENERLKTEVTYLREKLGFRSLRAAGGGLSRRPSSRDIPVGKIVEVTRRRRHANVPIRAEVVRNDDLELALQMAEPVETRAGDLWCARYAFGAYVWEFDTTAVLYSDRRLVLNHTDVVRFVNRRRFPRVAVTMPALVARFPFAKGGTRAWETDADADDGRLSTDIGVEAPTFVRAVVTELAGPGLRIDVPAPIRPGERVLVVFRPTDVGAKAADADPVADEACIMEDVGQVRHSRVIGTGVSIAVELMGLNETEVDELVRITNAIASRLSVQNDSDEAAAQTTMVGTAGDAVVVQEV